MSVIDRLAYEIGVDTSTMATGESAIRASMARIGMAMKSPLGITIGVGAALVGIGAKATSVAADWQKSWAEVRTIMTGTAEEIAAVETRVLDLANVVPQEQSLLAKGYYEVLSAGITDTADAYHVLEVAAKTAVGGLADTATSVDAITTILNAYGLEASESTRISDVLFTTVREGKVTFPELAGAIGRVIPFAAAAKISLEDVGAAIATLTKGGLQMEIAGTAVRGVLMAVLKPSKGAAEAAREMGLEFNSQALAAKGLVGFLQDVQEKTKGNSEAQARLFEDVRGLTAVLALAGEQSGEFARQQDIMINQAGGAANAAFEIMNNTLENQAQLLKNKLSRAWIELGNVLLGSVMKAITALNSISLDHTKQMESEADGVGKLRSEITRLDSTLIPLADRYDELSGKKIPLTTDETEELRKVTKLLAEAYPELVSAVDKSGEALEFNTGALRRNRLEIGRLFDKKGVKSFKEITDEITELTAHAARAQRRFETLQDVLQNQNGPLLTETSMSQSRNLYARSELEEIRDKDLEFLRTWKAKVAGLTETLAGVTSDIGLDAVIDEFVRLREAVNRTDEETKQMEKDEQILARTFGKEWVRTRIDGFKDLWKSMRDVTDETKKIVETEGEVGPGFKEMGGSTATDRAIDARMAAEKKAALELRAFIEENVGAAFFNQAQFDALGAEELAYFQNLLDERKKAEDQARTDREKAELDALKERQKIEIELMLDLEAKRQKAATGRVSRYGTYARDSAYTGGGMLAGVPINDPLAEVGPSLEAMGYTADKAAAQIDPLNDGLQQLAYRLGPQGVEGVVSNFLNSIASGKTLAQSLQAGGQQAAIDIAIDVTRKMLNNLFGGDDSGPSWAEKTKAIRDAMESFKDVMSTISFKDLSGTHRDLEEIMGALSEAGGAGSIARAGTAMLAWQKVRDLGIEIPEEIKGDWEAMGIYLAGIMDDLRSRIEDWGLFTADGIDSALTKWQFLIDAMDIDDPIQKWQKLVDLLKKSGDAGAESLGWLLSSLDTDEIEKATGLLAQIFAGGNVTDTNPLIQELAKLTGMSTSTLVAYLKQIIENGDMTPEQIAALLQELEGLGDEIGKTADAATGKDSYTVGRNVTLTEEQGRSIIGGINTQILLQRGIDRWLSGIYDEAQRIVEAIEEGQRRERLDDEAASRLRFGDPANRPIVVSITVPGAATSSQEVRAEDGTPVSVKVNTKARVYAQGFSRASRRGM